MTNKEKAIRRFAKAMRDANVVFMVETGKFTPNMNTFWSLYIEACREEDKNYV
jgi:hypothetical protein